MADAAVLMASDRATAMTGAIANLICGSIIGRNLNEGEHQLPGSRDVIYNVSTAGQIDLATLLAHAYARLPSSSASSRGREHMGQRPVDSST